MGEALLQELYSHLFGVNMLVTSREKSPFFNLAPRAVTLLRQSDIKAFKGLCMSVVLGENEMLKTFSQCKLILVHL